LRCRCRCISALHQEQKHLSMTSLPNWASQGCTLCHHTSVGLARTIYHICTVYIRCIWQGNYQVYGHIRCIYMVLADPAYHAPQQWDEQREHCISASQQKAPCITIMTQMDGYPLCVNACTLGGFSCRTPMKKETTGLKRFVAAHHWMEESTG
jgi:hypothetical protein